MPRLLQLDSSADLPTSRSRAIATTFADTWRTLGAEHTVTVRDLHADPLPHLPDATLHFPAYLRPEGSSPPADAEALQEELVAELLAADVVLIGAPLYNYSMPSALKAWIDYVHLPGHTAPFVEIQTQPMAGRHAVIVTSRGGAYDEGTPTADWDHAVPPLELILGTALGMEVTVITTSLTMAESVPALAPMVDRSRGELAAAHEQAAELARRLGGV